MNAKKRTKMYNEMRMSLDDKMNDVMNAKMSQNDTPTDTTSKTCEELEKQFITLTNGFWGAKDYDIDEKIMFSFMLLKATAAEYAKTKRYPLSYVEREARFKRRYQASTRL